MKMISQGALMIDAIQLEQANKLSKHAYWRPNNDIRRFREERVPSPQGPFGFL